jgi:hypothetical protein
MADRSTEPIPPGGGWGQPPEQGPPIGWGHHHRRDHLAHPASCRGGDAPREPA